MSVSGHRKPVAMVAQDLALDVYLEALLRDVETQVKAAAPAHAQERAVSLVEDRARDTESGALIQDPKAVSPAEIIPQWARAPFQTVVFHVAGLKLAVSLIELSGIAKGNLQITPIPGQPVWYLGLLPYRDKQVGVIDTVRLIMPERARPKPDEGRQPEHILFVNEGRWGLGCDRIAEVITLEPADVHWRTARSKRPWLAGTVVDQMCALLDIQAFVKLIEKA